jgi:hypothetical protein
MMLRNSHLIGKRSHNDITQQGCAMTPSVAIGTDALVQVRHTLYRLLLQQQ